MKQELAGASPVVGIKKDMKYTKELLSDIAGQSISVSDMLRKMGNIPITGPKHAHLTKKLKEFDVDCSHFKNGGQIIADNKRKTPEEIFSTKLDYRTTASRLRYALIESGVPYNCQLCHNDGNWHGSKMILEVDHIDGNPLNNEKDNLRFLCPNCHSIQSNHVGKNRKVNRKIYKCMDCSATINSRKKRCSLCHKNKKSHGRRQFPWPSRDELVLLYLRFNINQMAFILGASYNGMKKKLIRENILIA